MEIKVSFTPEEIELIRTVQTKSYCERVKCRDRNTAVDVNNR